MAFTASLVHSLAWPAGIVAVGVLFRRQISSAIGQGIRSLRVGPVDVIFREKLAEVQAEIPPGVAKAAIRAAETKEVIDTDNVLDRLVDADPARAVEFTFSRIEEVLSNLLEEAGLEPGPNPRDSIQLARESGLITDETYSAIDGLRQLRNLAASGGGREISISRGREYVALAKTVFYILNKATAERRQRS